MKIGLYDVDSRNYPNLCLMKISAYHKSKGDKVEWYFPMEKYDIVYVSKVFGNEYSTMDETVINAKRIIYGGTGFAISVKDGKEVFEKENHSNLPSEIEHMYPDYSLYGDTTKDTAYGFITRGCPNNCPFCIVSQKEGRISRKVADLSEWWDGQKNIELMDANILACKDRRHLLNQLSDSKAKINFSQGLDARFITEDVAEQLSTINKSRVHFAFDLMKNKEKIKNGLEFYKKHNNDNERDIIVYMLTNFNTTIKEDLERIKIIQDLGYTPDVRVYRKQTAPQVVKDLQRWCNNRIIYRSCNFMDYVPRADGKTIKQLYFED